MGKPLRHWWGADLPLAFAIEWSPDASKRCEGEVQRLYVRKTLDGTPGWRTVGLICLGCGMTSVDGGALAQLDAG